MKTGINKFSFLIVFLVVFVFDTSAQRTPPPPPGEPPPVFPIDSPMIMVLALAVVFGLCVVFKHIKSKNPLA